jgi:hypothetical protein
MTANDATPPSSAIRTAPASVGPIAAVSAGVENVQ